MKPFPWLLLFASLLAWAIVADLYFFRGPLHRHFTGHEDRPAAVAAVYGSDITKAGLEEAMRDHLFRTGCRWQDMEEADQEAFRRMVLDWLIDGSLIHAWRMREGLSQPPIAEAAQLEMDSFAGQFESPGDFDERAKMRQSTSVELLGQMRLANDDEAWIEQRIRPQSELAADAEAKAWFEKNRGSLAIPPSFRASHIYLTTPDARKPDREPEIRELHRQITAGEKSFEAVAAEKSEDERSKKTGGDLGWFTKDRMPEDFIAVVESFALGKTSEPVRTKLGWHIIKVADRKPARLPELAEVKDEILAMLKNQKRAKAIEDMLADLRQRAEQEKAIQLNSVLIGQAEPLPMTSSGQQPSRPGS